MREIVLYLQIHEYGNKKYLLTPLERNDDCIGEWVTQPDHRDHLITKEIRLYPGFEHYLSLFTRNVLEKIGGGLVPEI